MGPQQAWIWSLCDGQGERYRDAVRALGAAGVRVERRGDLAHGPGLVLLERFEERALHAVRTASRGGRERVAVLALEPQQLARGATWELLDAGAADVLGWDGSAPAALHVAERLRRWSQVDRLVSAPAVRDQLVGTSRAWLALLRQVVEIAAFTDSAVLLQGESGTGKELVARLIHTLDARERKRDLVVLDCSAVVAELAGSEFFGHERGAYTGAAAVRDGAFALSDGGTLFLDEIGELPPTLQAQILRAVQERTYKRVGGNDWLSSNFRLVSATNRDLEREVGDGRFRGDLYHRLTTAVCRLPPLRERAEDILPLVTHFVAELLPGAPALDDPVRDYLLTRDYPGNVRQLRQLVHRICRRHVGGGPITAGDLPDDERPRGGRPPDWRDGPFCSGVRGALARGVSLRELGRGAEDLAVALAIDDEQGNLQRAARRLGVTDRALQLRRAREVG